MWANIKFPMRSAKMNISISDAYNKGRVAGANHFFSLRRDANAVAPKSPNSDPFMPANKEWDLGFNSGFEQAKQGHLRAKSLTIQLR
jgi:hypothetical protein